MRGYGRRVQREERGDVEQDGLGLFVATDEDKVARDRLTHDAWGAKLSVEQYLEREARLRAHPWTRAGMTTWLLREGGAGGAGGAGGRVVASCESFRSPSTLDGRAGTSFAIASVYTEPSLRGKGYAGVLMRRVAEALARQPSAHAVTLYSDVGAALYERAGYVAVPAFDRVLAASAGDPAEGVDALVDEHELASDVPPGPAGERFLIWPTGAQLDWHVERERAYAALLGRPRLVCAGARAGTTWARWCGNLKSGTLIVLLTGGEEPDGLARVLRAAARVAHRAELASVSVWETPPLAAAWPAGVGTRIARDGSLPMIRCFDAALAPEDFRIVPRALWV